MTATIKPLRLYTNESAHFGDRKVFDVVIARALQQGLAGATALQARSGFGKSARLRSRHMLDETRSVVVEIIDEEAGLRRFIEVLKDLPDVGLTTVESVELLRSGADRAMPESTFTSPVTPARRQCGGVNVRKKESSQ